MIQDVQDSARGEVTLRLDVTGEIEQVSGDSDRLLGLSSVDLWRRPLTDVFKGEALARIQKSMKSMVNGRAPTRIVMMPDGDGQPRHFALRVRAAGSDLTDGILVQFRPTQAPDMWDAAPVYGGLGDRSDDAGGFLDNAAGRLADGQGDAGLTVLAVKGGASAFRDQEAATAFHRVVDEQARGLGADGAASLDDGAYGILHDGAYDSESLKQRVTQEAVSQKLVADEDAISAQRIDADGTELSAREVRGTFGHMVSGVRRGLGRGLKRMGLSQGHTEARDAAAEMLAEVSAAIRTGQLRRRMRPILSLKRNRVAMHQVTADLMLRGEAVEPERIFGLIVAEEQQREFELALVDQALIHHHECKVWQSVAYRVVVSIRRQYLSDPKVQAEIAAHAERHGVKREFLVLRPYDPLSGALTGGGDELVSDGDHLSWTTSVPDFYAFIAGDARRRAARQTDAIAGFIEVAADRLRGLTNQADGAFLVRGLIDTWRQRGIELICTGVNNAEDLQFTKDLAVRYARGRMIGDWESRY